MPPRPALLLFPLLLTGLAAAADEPLVPPADGKPILQLDAGGPMAAVTALAFGPDGKTLYVGGFDKVVRVWTLDDKTGAFTARATYRVPVGPGMNGLINALAVSPDGRWLAVAGSGAVRGTAGFGETGLIVPLPGRLSPVMEHDWGAIYLFDLNKDKDAVTPLRAHRAPVLGLTFLPALPGKPPLLVSLGREGQGAMAVRLWDAAAGRLLAERVDLPDPGGNEPPGLAAWHTGPKDNEVGAAVALARDYAAGKDALPGRLNYWDAAADRLQSTELDPGWQFTNTAAFLPGKAPRDGVLFTGGLWLKKGDAPAGAYVSAWTLGDGKPQKDADRTEFINKGAPKTLVFVPKPGGGPADLAAAVEEFPGQSPPYRLVLVGRTDAGGFRDEKVSANLWDAAGPVAVTAASPGGARLAVSGGADHDVWIYSVDDLLKGKTDPLQKLGAAGVRATGVGFVRKGGTPGLLVRQDRPGGRAAREWVLDSGGRGLQEGRAGWEDDGPDLDGWKVTPGDGMTFTVVKDGNKVGEVRLATGQSKSFRPLLPCYALLPPCKPLDKALLAVGYVEEGVSYLELFDVVADRRVRRFSGHVNVVRGLSFSKDGRFLASASDDETVAVWSLTDLDKTIGRGGALPGLVVEQKGDKAAVASLDDALSAENRKALESAKVGVGDAVEGAVAGKTLKPFRSPQDFYDAAWATKPGGAVVVRVGGRDISLTTDQGEDERKPLFSFFMGDEDRDRLWLAWTPVGPYDTADRPRAEAVIGWHANTGKASAPVEFSPAALYRKETYRPGLLQYLFAKGDVSEALDQWKAAAAPKPGVGLRLEAPKTPFLHDAEGRVLVQGPPKGLTLRAELFGILPAKVRRVRWRFDDGDWRDFGPPSELAFTAELDKADLDWRGATHEFSVLVDTEEADALEYPRRLQAAYAPAAPEITSEQAPAAEVVAAEFPFKAVVVPAKDGPAAKVLVTVRLNNGAPKAVGAEIAETLHLAEGDNFIEVRAENEGAAPEFRDAQTTTRRWRVRYLPPKKVAPPTVYLESVSSASDKPQDEKPLVVHSRTVRVRGRVVSSEPVVEATCDGRPLAGLAAPDADKKDLLIDEPITLKAAGAEEAVKFVARHAKGDPATKTLVLKYEPRAPRFEFDRDAPPPAVPNAADPVPLRGRVLKENDDPSEYKVEVRLNGAALAGANLKADRLDASFTPRPGDNVVEVVVSNPFDRGTAAAHCRRLRSPEVKNLVHTEPGARGLVDLTALVESPADRPLSGARVSSDSIDRLTPKITWEKQPPVAAGAGLQTWKVVAAGVALKNGGKNRLSFWARNEDGEGAAPAPAEIVRNLPAPRETPDVEVVDPRVRNEVVKTPTGWLAFRVRWHGPEGKVAVLVNDRELEKAEAGLASSPPDADGVVTYQTDALPLESGPNVVRAVAVNGEGGRGRGEPYTLVYLPGAAFIRLTGLSAGAPAAEADAPLGRGDRLAFPRQDSADVWVHGEVEWPDETDPMLTQDRPPHLRVWVNDFEQFEAPLEARRGRVRRFTAPLRLIDATNRVEIGSSDVKVEKAAFGVPCSRPARDQRLHLLVVAPGRRDEAKVSEEALAAFQARHVDGDRFDTAAFRDGRLYGPVIKLTQREEVFDAVENMKGAIRGGADDLNDVIVVLFQGEQLVTGDEHYLLTGETKKLLPGLKPGEKLDASRLATLRETALTCDRFREWLGDARGARLVVLDAQDPLGGKDSKERVRDILDRSRALYPRIGCLDYVLLGAEDPRAGDRLLSLLRTSLEQQTSLKDLTGKEEDWSRGPNQLFKCYVPEGLLSINLGRTPK